MMIVYSVYGKRNGETMERHCFKTEKQCFSSKNNVWSSEKYCFSIFINIWVEKQYFPTEALFLDLTIMSIETVFLKPCLSVDKHRTLFLKISAGNLHCINCIAFTVTVDIVYTDRSPFPGGSFRRFSHGSDPFQSPFGLTLTEKGRGMVSLI